MKKMVDDVLFEILLFMPFLLFAQLMGLGIAVVGWSLCVFTGIYIGFITVWKAVALGALVIAFMAKAQFERERHQLEAKGRWSDPRDL